MRLNLRRTISAQSPISIAVQQFLEQIPCCIWHDALVGGEVQRLVENLAVHFIRVFVVEGGKTCQHFVEEDAESPPVNGFVVAGALKKFGGEVFRCAAEC